MGMAQISFEMKKYEVALEWAIIAYAIYEPTYSESIADCSALLKSIYIELDKNDRTYLFNIKIEDYNLDLHDKPWLN